MRLPGLTLSHQVLSTLPLDAIGLQTGRDMDVIIGYPLLRECVVEVDYSTRVVMVWEPRAAPERKIGASIPLQLIEHLPYVQASVQLPGGKALEGRFVIDTGAMTALMLSAPFVETHGVLDAIDTTIQVRLGGVGGPVENPLGRLQSVRLGPYVLERPVTAFRTPGRGSISAEGTAGNIGGRDPAPLPGDFRLSAKAHDPRTERAARRSVRGRHDRHHVPGGLDPRAARGRRPARFPQRPRPGSRATT